MLERERAWTVGRSCCKTVTHGGFAAMDLVNHGKIDKDIKLPYFCTLNHSSGGSDAALQLWKIAYAYEV